MIELFNSWIDTNKRLKNCECLMSKFPNDMSLKVEHQHLKESEAKLKIRLDKSRAIKEEVQQRQSDSGVNTW